MIIHDSNEVKRKALAILKVLSQAREPLGARVIARHLQADGFSLSERTVRYHLQHMDEQGLTKGIGWNGRLITPEGREELKNALVSDKMALVISRIECLSYGATFDLETCQGQLPVNLSLFTQESFSKALQFMQTAFQSGLCVSDLVAVVSEGETLGDVQVPMGKVGLATVCSLVVNSALLKAGIPVESRFGGILEMRRGHPLRFIELISYSGSSIYPSEVFIRGRMTNVREAALLGTGKLLANFREIPAPCRPQAEAVMARLEEAGLRCLLAMGRPGEHVCEVPVGPNRVGIVLLEGLNPAAVAEEMGIPSENRAMCATLDYRKLRPFRQLAESIPDLTASSATPPPPAWQTSRGAVGGPVRAG